MSKFLPADLMVLHEYFSENVGIFHSAEEIEAQLKWIDEDKEVIDPNHRRLKKSCDWLTDLGAPVEIAEGVLVGKHPNAKGYRYKHAAFAPNVGLKIGVDHYTTLALVHRWMGSVMSKTAEIDEESTLLQLRKQLSYGDPELDHALERLSKRIVVMPGRHRPVDASVFRAIAFALRDRKQLIFDYAKGSETKTYQVHPQILLFYRENWYLRASFHPKEKPFTFSLDLIQSIDTSGKGAFMDPVAEVQGAGYGLLGEGEPQLARLRFQASDLHYAQREMWHPDQNWIEDSDGAMILELPYVQSEELLRDILWYGAGVEVQEPKSLRTALRAELLKAAGAYGVESD